MWFYLLTKPIFTPHKLTVASHGILQENKHYTTMNTTKEKQGNNMYNPINPHDIKENSTNSNCKWGIYLINKPIFTLHKLIVAAHVILQ